MALELRRADRLCRDPFRWRTGRISVIGSAAFLLRPDRNVGKGGRLRNVHHRTEGPSWAAQLSRGTQQSRRLLQAAALHLQAAPRDPQAVAAAATIWLP